MTRIKAFEDFLIGEDKSINTISCYIRDTKAFLEWYSGRSEYGLEKLIELDTVAYKRHLQSSYDSAVTINRKIASVNTFLRWLKTSGYIDKELGIGTIRNKDKRQYKGLEEQELRKLRSEIHRADNKMHIAIVEILIGTGIRVSELVDLKLSNIEISARKGKAVVTGKGNAVRTVPLNKDVRRAIAEYLKVRRNTDEEYLLIGQRGKLERNAINLILKKYAQRIGIEVTPHKLRHTLGYKLIKEGEPITLIQQILGHENIQTTNIYTLTTEKDKTAALEGLEW